LHGDLRNPSDIESLPACDWIIDAAANPNVLAGIDGKTSSRQLVEHNLTGTTNLLEFAKHWKSGLILLSTSRVYSIAALAKISVKQQGQRFVPALEQAFPIGATERGISEDFSTEPPLSLYGATKRASEILALEYAETFGLPLFINRCGVLAGAGQFGKIDQGIFSYWIHSYARKRPLKFIGFDGSGFQVRDCLHVHDLARLVERQLNFPDKKAPKICNVSGGLQQSASLKELSDWCAARFGKVAIHAEPKNRPFDIAWVVLDSARAEEHWTWSPKISLHKIWEEIARHAEENPNWLDYTAD
jgi:CDP-paratose 2-epimerase